MSRPPYDQPRGTITQQHPLKAMTPAEVREVFAAALEQSRYVSILFAGRDEPVRFLPDMVGQDGANGTMHESGSWPRSAHFGRIVHAEVAS